MQIESWEDFRREIGTLAEAYDRKHTSELDDAYWSALAKMQFKDFKRCAQFVREKAGTDGFSRLPKPGQFWGYLNELRAADRPRRDPTLHERMPRAQHLAHLRRQAIEVAKRATMPKYKGVISKDVPDHHKAQSDAEWAEWEATYGQEPDEYWLPAAFDLVSKWGEPNAAQEIDIGAVFREANV